MSNKIMQKAQKVKCIYEKYVTINQGGGALELADKYGAGN